MPPTVPEMQKNPGGQAAGELLQITGTVREGNLKYSRPFARPSIASHIRRISYMGSGCGDPIVE